MIDMNELKKSAYKIDFIKEKQEIINQAKELWKIRCQEYLNQFGDKGSCVLGASIQILFLAPKKRIPKYQNLISVSSVCSAQGSLVWENSVNEVISFLKSNGIDCSYNPGFMD